MKSRTEHAASADGALALLALPPLSNWSRGERKWSDLFRYFGLS